MQINQIINELGKESLGELIKVSTLINSSLDLSEILTHVMELTNRLLNCEASSLLLLNEKTNELSFKTATGEKAQDMKAFNLKMGQGIAGWVAQKEKAVIIPDVEKDPRHFSQADSKTGFKTKSILCVPMKAKGQLIGVLEGINKKENLVFDEADLSLASILADQAATAIQNARVYEELQQDHENLKKEVRPKQTLVGKSKIIQDILKMAGRAAQGDSTLLIRGKSGTGKEMLARAIHQLSPRSNKPFVCVTCSILTQTLLESELFGHEKGAFTGADSRKIGRFEMADGGTLFLDEIGTLAPETQLRLLRVLQDKEFERVGGRETIKVNVRIIAATNEDLEKGIQENKFREDLYYRLKVIEIFMPELKDRSEDIPILAQHFLEIYSREMARPVKGISKEAIEILRNYHWPGNVRELKNTIERSVVLGSSEYIVSEDLTTEIRHPREGATSLPSREGPSQLPSGNTLEEAEIRHIQEILVKTNGNKSKAAELLGISRNRLDRKLAGIKPAAK
ncbi:MAG: sigma-54-dependent Fis family transcriptional regulator [Chlamydiae bacterium]|nr:sigma-54-dependent Fis family transcriptional regulator [Chlamydiota bacterium]MBI3267079.1 sigma-54-dependent Fis family transcriptional regulator [Chlamydiota bacterium]